MSHRPPELTLTDRLRLLAEGRLAPDQARALRREIEGDAGALEFLRAYQVVQELGGEFEPAAPNRPAPRRAQPWRRPEALSGWAAAALLLAAGGLALALHWPGTRAAPRPATVTLAAIPLEAPPLEELDPVPGLAATYDPESATGIAWVEDPEVATELATLARRPLLVYLYHPSCPLCRQLTVATFPDPSVVQRAEACVPVRLNVLDAPERYARLAEEGWPYLGVHHPDGSPLLSFPGLQTGPDLAAHLDQALAEASADRSPLPWAELRARAGQALQGVAALGRGDATGAEALFSALAASDPEGFFGRLGRQGLLRLALRARAIVEESRKAVVQDPARARQILSDGVEELAGTAPGKELQAVLAALQTTGLYPTLVADR